MHLAGGRVFTAALDAQTDADRLWLRFERGGAELLRPIDWDRVVTADLSGSRLSGPELRRLVEQVRREIPASPAETAAATRIVMIGSPSSPA